MGSLPSRSSLLMKVAMGVWRIRQTSQSLRVRSSTPFTESITRRAESTARAPGRCPRRSPRGRGVSRRLIFLPLYSKPITEVEIEIPLSFSISMKSETEALRFLPLLTAPAMWMAPPKRRASR